MTDLISEFSRNHCIGICAFLVPANLLITLQTLIFVGLRRPAKNIYWVAIAATCYALLMVLHVATWFMVGVVMAPTFVLLALGTVCLTLNVWAVAAPDSMARTLRWLWTGIVGRRFFARTAQDQRDLIAS